jgi:hypothetical protein
MSKSVFGYFDRLADSLNRRAGDVLRELLRLLIAPSSFLLSIAQAGRPRRSHDDDHATGHDTLIDR